MKKIRGLLIVLLLMIVGVMFNATKVNATDLSTLKSSQKFAKEYNAKNFGSNEVGINAAIKTASEQGTKDGKQALVFIPRGTYNIKDRILVYSNVYIL